MKSEAPISPLQRALDDVVAERERQDAKWGEQNHPSVDPVLTRRSGGCTPQRMAEEYEIPSATRAKWLCGIRHKRGDGTWADIVVEELAEAVEAAVEYGDASVELRVELVQTAAVIVAWIEAIDRGTTTEWRAEARYRGVTP